jgi:hypothetical protein
MLKGESSERILGKAFKTGRTVLVRLANSAQMEREHPDEEWKTTT